jgi:hypothetical protein
MASRITSITGLQNLTGLVNFYADWNSLTSVNLSNLPNLVHVDVSDQNDILTDENCLTSVNLSGSTAIEELYMDDNDFSAGIPDISGLSSLRVLDMDQCRISGVVDLSMFPDLTNVDLNGNINITSVILFEQSITDIDLSNNALTQECVDDVLMWLDGSGEENGYADLADGTNASPSGAGLTAYNNLIAKGWDVNANGITTTTTTTTPVFSFSVRRWNTGPCESRPFATIYSDSPVLGPGINVYNDVFLTSPIQSSAYICDCGNSVQYFISPTGIISHGTPITCI